MFTSILSILIQHYNYYILFTCKKNTDILTPQLVYINFAYVCFDSINETFIHIILLITHNSYKIH